MAARKQKRAAPGRTPPRTSASPAHARENGWAISGLVALYNATGAESALQVAQRAARYILANRQNSDGSFTHGDRDRAGPYLGDTLAMGQAALDLYAATGDREWLTIADQAGAAIAARFKDTAGGFRTTLTPEAAVGVFLNGAKPLDEQVAVTHFANRLYRYLGKESYRKLAEHGARATLPLPRFSICPARCRASFLPIRNCPNSRPNITIVGHKNDAQAAALYMAALAIPAVYKRIDWWDKREGALPNPDVEYPELELPAAFACTNRICSRPVFDPAELGGTVADIMAASRGG